VEKTASDFSPEEEKLLLHIFWRLLHVNRIFANAPHKMLKNASKIT